MYRHTHTKDLAKNEKRKWQLCGILAASGFMLLAAAKAFPGMADWYSRHVYRVLVCVFGRFFGLFPFSVAEICLYIACAFVCASIVIFITRLVLKKPVKGKVRRWTVSVLLAVAILWFLYVINCGINYERRSFSEDAGIETRDYTVEELKEACVWLTRQVNNRSSQVRRDENHIAEAGDNVGEEVVNAMGALGEIYPQMSGYYPRPKGLIFPWILSVQNLTGIYSPFTIEANYNSGMTEYNIPFTACHELSHLKGYMQEQEANFIAFLACMESEKMEFQYSGSLMGWIYCMNVLKKEDTEAWKEVREKLSPEAEADLRANNRFWAQYDGRIAEVSNKVNDTYLKANGQADGVKSYDRMVDLIVAWGTGYF